MSTAVLADLFAAFNAAADAATAQMLADAHSAVLALDRQVAELTALAETRAARITELEAAATPTQRRAEALRDNRLEAARLHHANDVARLRVALARAFARSDQAEVYRQSVERIPLLLRTRRAAAANAAGVNAELVVLAIRTVETANRRYAASRAPKLAATG